MATGLLNDADKLKSKIIAARRHIHQYPEVGYEEEKTSKFVASILSDLGLKLKTGVAKTGVVGLLKGARAGRTIAVRADMDALPIGEQLKVSFASKNDGVMHACGHDGNMATVLGCAMLLSTRTSELKGNVKFIFQPSEEAPPGGAEPMIKEGVLEKPKVDAILGVHVDPVVPSGKIGLRWGPMMAAADEFELAITGEAAHGARPHQGIDAVVLSAEVIQALQTIPSRMVDPVRPMVLTVGTIHGGYKFNIVADRVDMTGTVRTIDPSLRKRIPKMMEKMVSRITSSAGGGYELNYITGYPVLICDDGMTNMLAESTRKLLGKKSVVELAEPMMGGEDFAFFTKAVPGTMMRLGVGNKKKDCIYPWHHPKFNLDEDALPIGSAVLAQAVLDYLS